MKWTASVNPTTITNVGRMLLNELIGSPARPKAPNVQNVPSIGGTQTINTATGRRNRNVATTRATITPTVVNLISSR